MKKYIKINHIMVVEDTLKIILINIIINISHIIEKKVTKEKIIIENLLAHHKVKIVING